MLTEGLKQQIEQIYGQEIKYPRDCDGLAVCITEKTGNSISSSTLKRLFGFVKATSNPSQFTLDTISIYLGFLDWASLEKSLKKENSNEKTVAEVEKTSEIPTTNIKRRNYRFVLMGGIILVTLAVWLILHSTTNTEKWNELALMPEVRSGGRTIVNENSIFYIGGADAEFMRANVWKYDFEANKWSILNTMPTPRADFACARIGNLIYCFGGYLGEREGATNKVEVYNIAKNEWKELSEMKQPLISGRAISHGADIYILGGSFGETKNIFLKFDTESGDYIELKVFDTPKNHFTMSAVDERIYVIGGMSFHNGEYVWHNSVAIFDIKTGKWSVGEEMPVNIASSTAITVGDEIHIIGGSDKYGNDSDGLSDKYFIYNTTKNSWKENEKLSFKIQSAEGISFDSKLFLFGGSTDFPNPSKKVRVK